MPSAQGAWKSPETLNIISLNCWGLKYLSAHRAARLTQIGHELARASPTPDIVTLQECWTQADYHSIRSLTSSILPYGKFYHSGVFGGGLVILSRFLIEESSMHRYPLNGRPTAFFRGDWFVGKGVASASIRIGPSENDVVEVLNTHLHASYELEPNDSYICHRTAQAWEIAKSARAARAKGRLVIAAGDYNMIPSSLAHEIVTVQGGLNDVWQVVQPDSSVGAAEDEAEKARKREMPSVEFNLQVNGTTCDSLDNTWRITKEQQKRIANGENVNAGASQPDKRAKRLDYIFVSKRPLSDTGHRQDWTVKGAKVGMRMRHPELHCSLSDHFSIETQLVLTSDLDATSKAADSSMPSIQICGPEPSHLLPPSTYSKIEQMLAKYIAREHRQRHLRLGHFIASLFISIGCLIAVWWSPHNYISFVLMLLSTLGLTAGTIDGLIGGLFVGSEMRALREFEWEVQTAKRRAEEMMMVAAREGEVK